MTGRKLRPRISGAERLGILIGSPRHEQSDAPISSQAPAGLQQGHEAALQPWNTAGDEGGGLEAVPLPTLLPAGAAAMQDKPHAPWHAQPASQAASAGSHAAIQQAQQRRPSISAQAAAAGHPARAARLLSGRRTSVAKGGGPTGPHASGARTSMHPLPPLGVAKHVQSASAPSCGGQEAIPAHLRLRSRVSALQR